MWNTSKWGEGRIFAMALAAGLMLTAVSSTVGLALGAAWPTWLEAAAVSTSFSSTLLFVLQRRQCYIWGVVTTLLYAELFRRFQLPASAAVNLYLMGALFYGYWRWGPDGCTRPVTRVLPLVWWLAYIAATAAAWLGAAYISRLLGSPLYGWDGAILAVSILAQWLLDNKKLETWFVWLGVNAMAIPVYGSAGLTLVAVQYVFFAANALWGFYLWRSAMSEPRVSWSEDEKPLDDPRYWAFVDELAQDPAAIRSHFDRNPETH